MRPKVLLVYANPAVTATPVPPYGMERIAQAFQMAGCDPEMIVPFIEDDPLAALASHLDPLPDLVGFSVRNLDDALVVRSEDGATDIDTAFYLDEIRPLVALANARVGSERIVLGGTGILAGPDEVRTYLGADVAIRGPAEDLCFVAGRELGRTGQVVWAEDPRVVRSAPSPTSPPGRPAWRPPPGATPRLGPYLGLTLARGGRVPIQISAGCDRRCDFCVEARFLEGRVVPRAADDVFLEAKLLHGLGVRRVWLSGSELNVPNERHARQVLTALAPLRLDLQVFLQVAPVTHALLDALEDAGVDPTTLSFELGHLADGVLRAGGGPANLRHIEALVDLWIARGYRTLGGSVLLGAHPAETDETLERALDKALEIDRALPQGFGLVYACGGRVYPASGLADWVRTHRDEAGPHLYGARDPSFTQPVVFSRPGSPRSLLRHVRRRLERARGPMRPMNAEARHSPEAVAAERLVNRGIWRAQTDRPEDARHLFEDALRIEPQHQEGLAQLGLLLANTLDDPGGAVRAFERLVSTLSPGDARRIEVDAALDALRGRATS